MATTRHAVHDKFSHLTVCGMGVNNVNVITSKKPTCIMCTGEARQRGAATLIRKLKRAWNKHNSKLKKKGRRR